MNVDVKKMLRAVTVCDLVVAALIFFVALIIKPEYSLILLFGIITAVFNFYVSTITANLVLVKGIGTKLLIVFSSVFRVILVCIISILLYKIKQYYLIAYIAGYSAHFIALIFYGLLLKNNERKWLNGY